MGEVGFFAMFLMVGAVGVSVLLGPIGSAVARRLAGGKQDPKTGLSTGEMAAERVAQLEQRVHELEERLDFAERMLAQSRESAVIEPRTPS
ncbi:MAG: hypothetical protein FJ206_14945 [Gemmatimonadetes bacterium]|nr:hypothetical protein [Gemmatimonadota bacterium]